MFISSPTVPCSMLLFGDGQCLKLCDFGTARDISQTMEMTKNVGTIRYMAPEVLRGSLLVVGSP